MKVLLVLLSCLLFAEGGLAQSKKSLTELDRIDIEVEDLKPFDHEIGLSEESLKSLVLVDVKRDIPKIKIQRTISTYIYVRITSTRVSQFSAASYVTVEVKRPVNVLTEPDNKTICLTIATVWDKGALISGAIDGLAERIRQEISSQLTEFAAEYYRQNP